MSFGLLGELRRISRVFARTWDILHEFPSVINGEIDLGLLRDIYCGWKQLPHQSEIELCLSPVSTNLLSERPTIAVKTSKERNK